MSVEVLEGAEALPKLNGEALAVGPGPLDETGAAGLPKVKADEGALELPKVKVDEALAAAGDFVETGAVDEEKLNPEEAVTLPSKGLGSEEVADPNESNDGILLIAGLGSLVVLLVAEEPKVKPPVALPELESFVLFPPEAAPIPNWNPDELRLGAAPWSDAATVGA